MQGTIKWFNDAKGYGFITSGARAEYFFHRMELADKTQLPVPGDPVEFSVVDRPKGPTAVRVRLLTPARMPQEGA